MRTHKGLPKIKIGQRIAFKLGKLYYYGVVASLDKGNLTVRSDSGKLLTKVGTSNCIPVEQWENNNGSFKDGVVQPTYLEPLDMYKMNKPVNFDLNVIWGMWYFLNHNLFANRLDPNKTSITIESDPNLHGQFTINKDGFTRLMLSRIRVTAQDLFMAVGHEMCHQAQYLLEHPGETAYRGGHDESFHKWADRYEKRFGVKINVKGVIDEHEPIHPEEVKTTYYVIVIQNKGNYYAGISTELKEIVRYAEALSSPKRRTDIYALNYDLLPFVHPPFKGNRLKKIEVTTFSFINRKGQLLNLNY